MQKLMEFIGDYGDFGDLNWIAQMIEYDFVTDFAYLVPETIVIWWVTCGV